MKLTEKQQVRFAKVQAHYPQFTFRLHDEADGLLGVKGKPLYTTVWGVTVYQDEADMGHIQKPKAKNGFRAQAAHTTCDEADVKLVRLALNAASAAIWHTQTHWDS